MYLEVEIFNWWKLSFFFQIVSLNFGARKASEEASDDFRDLAADMLKNITMRLPALNDEKKRFKIPPIKKNKFYSSQLSDNDETPSLEIMKNLEAELGSFASHEAIMNPAIHDKILLSSSSVNMSLRELSDVRTEDLMDPSDFVSVVQNS